MKRVLAGLAYAALALSASGAAYLWGYHRGMSYHAVLSGMSEAKWSLSAAQSLRARDPRLALELLEANISWMDVSLEFEDEDVPAAERGNYDIVKRRLDDYRRRYGAPGSD